jgi:pimeloyl-ACP methyl ester carboxylesterase
MASGYYENGLPFNRFGRGKDDLVIFQGLQFENKPLSGLAARFVLNLYDPLAIDYTIHSVTRRPGLPHGYTIGDMARDYATMIEREFKGSIDIVGLSTGGMIAQQFAADHSHLVRRLVIHSGAHRLSDEAREFQMRVRDLARERKWRDAYATVLAYMSPTDGIKGRFARVGIWAAAPFGRFLFGRPADPSDLVVTYDASNNHTFQDRLAEIKAPTLVIAGVDDPFYTPQLFRETAEGIPGAQLILYEGVGHPASGKQFSRDVLSFLRG